MWGGTGDRHDAGVGVWFGIEGCLECFWICAWVWLWVGLFLGWVWVRVLFGRVFGAGSFSGARFGLRVSGLVSVWVWL